MANEQNLIPGSQRSKSELREIGRKGGIKSGEVRRAKKDFRESMLTALSELIERKSDSGKVLEKISAQDAICLKQIAKALKGDTYAAKFCVDVAADKKAEAPQQTVQVYIKDYEYEKKVADHIDAVTGDAKRKHNNSDQG